MKPHEMRELTEPELRQHRDGLVQELVNLKIKLAVKQLDNPLRVRSTRREIARANSILRQKELGAKPGQVVPRKEKA